LRDGTVDDDDAYDELESGRILMSSTDTRDMMMKEVLKSHQLKMKCFDEWKKVRHGPLKKVRRSRKAASSSSIDTIVDKPLDEEAEADEDNNEGFRRSMMAKCFSTWQNAVALLRQEMNDLFDEILNAPIVQRPFIGPLLPDAERPPAMEFGKRARVSMDREAKLVAIQDQLEGSLGRLQNDAIFAPLLGHIQALPAFNTVIGNMDRSTAMAAEKAIGMQTTETRLLAIHKILNGPHLTALNAMETKLKHAREALNAAALLSVYRAYANESGLVQWEELHKDILERL
jgi:hypothetical protein